VASGPQRIDGQLLESDGEIGSSPTYHTDRYLSHVDLPCLQPAKALRWLPTSHVTIWLSTCTPKGWPPDPTRTKVAMTRKRSQSIGGPGR
jgi:hypothetical protein